MAEQKTKEHSSDIKYDSNNYRIHSEQNKDLIKKSLEDCGTGRSILIDGENEIIAGNGVYEQAQKLGLPVRVIETNGEELIAVKRTDLKTDDDKRKQLAVMDNSTSDTSEFDIAKLQDDFEIAQLNEFGINLVRIEDELIDNEELMNNDNLQEMQTNKMLALSKLPISSYLLIHFDDDSCTKEEFIEKYAKKLNPASDIDEKTQFCDYAFMKKDVLEEL